MRARQDSGSQASECQAEPLGTQGLEGDGPAAVCLAPPALGWPSGTVSWAHGPAPTPRSWP